MNITSIHKIIQGVVGLMLIISHSLGNEKEEEIPETITICGMAMVKGQYVILEGIRIDKIPEEIEKHTSWEALYINETKMSTIPTEIEKLTSLEVLHLYKNQLNSIPTQIGSLISLKILILDDNQLCTIPTEIGNLTSLTQLCLANNKLSTLPYTICHLTNLEKLLLQNNPLLGDEAPWANHTLHGEELKQCLAFYRQKDSVITQNIIAKHMLLLSGNRQEDELSVWSLMPEEIIMYISTILYQLRFK